MEKYIEELFEDAQPFDEGEIYQSREYNACMSENLYLERLMEELFGASAYRLLQKFLDSYYEIERFNCLHYFYQGYLAGKKKEKPYVAGEKG